MLFQTRSTDVIHLNQHCSLSLQRTLRIPDDGGEYPLPPSLGTFAPHPTGENEYVVPMRRGEATWLSFETPWWRPHALKVGIGNVDAISGEGFDPDRLRSDEQDYVVVPDQPWLDGINCGDGFIRQFVAVPLGAGLTVESQLSEAPGSGGLTLSLFEPVPGRFPEEPPRPADDSFGADGVIACEADSAMGLGARGRMRQEIFADEYGIEAWQDSPARTVRIELVDEIAFEALTGLEVSGEPIDAETYTRFGFPWFDLLEPSRRDIEASELLAGVRSVAELEERVEGPLPIPEAQVVRLLDLRERVG